MKRPTWFRRRHVWLPTPWGCLVVLSLGCILLAGIAQGICPFLSPTRPVGARLLVVEGWMPEDELEQAARLYRSGGYERLVTTGGPIPGSLRPEGVVSYADLSRIVLARLGVPEDALVAIPAPESAQDRTFLSAVRVREWANGREGSIEALDVFSSSVHSRRSWDLFEKAFGPGVRVGIVASRPGTFDPDAWWRTSAGVKTVLSESIGWIWTRLFFHPAPPGSPGETWGTPRSGPRR